MSDAVVDDVASDAGVADAGSPSQCAEPKHLVQLGTLKDSAVFAGELLVGQDHAYDPTSFASRDRPAPAPPVSTEPYFQVVGDFGLTSDQDGSVVNIRTMKTIVTTAGLCDAGGATVMRLSATARFLVCYGRQGISVIDLNPVVGPVKNEWRWIAGAGAQLAPNDRYAIDVPEFDRATDKPTRASITRIDLETGKSLPLLAAHLSEDRSGFYAPAFCGAGELFASAGDKEVVVFRADGTRLASAPAMRGGVVSFSASGRYLSQLRGDKTTVFRLDP